MIPSKNWFPQSLQERAAWFTNFNTQMQAIGASLGFTAAELTALAHDGETFDYLAMAATQLDAYSNAMRTYRHILTEGKIGDPAPCFRQIPF